MGENDTRVNLAVDSVRVEGRYRREVGDVSGLAASIEAIGLLHPIVVTPDWKLVAGQRRLEACRALGWKRIPATVAANLNDAARLLIAERDENTCREPYLVSEMVALGKALEALERPKAKERMEWAKDGGDPPSGNLPEGSRRETVDIVGSALGVSATTYRRAKVVIEASEDPGLPEHVRAAAVDARSDMDQTGKVTPAFNRIAPLIGRTPALGQHRRTEQALQSPQPYVPSTERQHVLAGGQKDRLARGIVGISGYCQGLHQVDVRMALAAMDADETADLRRQSISASQFLRVLAQKLNIPEGKS